MKRTALLCLVVMALGACTLARHSLPCEDTDGDGLCNDEDGCPDNAEKVEPGSCGCSLSDADDDGDGIADCVGCADGQREAYLSLTDSPDIAACSGGWSVPGVIDTLAACGHRAGNNSSNPSGMGCSAADLCQPSWRLCGSAADVSASSPTGCMGAETAQSMFFAVRQSGPGSLMCGSTGANDLFGCGTLGLVPDPSCAPLTRTSNNLCASLSEPWQCGSDTYAEARNVSKPGPAAGGVLCCRSR
jgi:hypothetical protein